MAGIDDHTRRVERSLLGALMLDPAQLGAVDLTAAAYIDPGHRALHSLMASMRAAGEVIDAATLPLRVEREGADRYGGLEYVIETLDHAAGPASVPHLALTVDRLAAMRELASACTDALAMVRGEMDAAQTQGTASPDEVVAMLDQRLAAVRSRGGAASEVWAMSAAIDRVADKIEARCKGELDEVWPTGLPVDAVIRGLQPGRMYVIGGGTGSGKSTMAARVASKVSASVGVLLVSLEMGVVEIAEREIAASASVRLAHITADAPSDREWDAVIELREEHVRRERAGAGLHVYDGDQPGLARIEALARRYVERLGVRVVVVDYLQLVEVEDSRQPRHVAVGMVSRRLKALSRSLGVAVVALAQVNRGVDTRSSGTS